MKGRLFYVAAIVTMLALGWSAIASAQTVLLSEDFEGTTGADISALGWTQLESEGRLGPAITISDTVIDSGKSGVVAAADDVGTASVYKKDLAYTIGANEELVLTATVHVYASSFLMDEAGVYLSTPKGIYYMAVDKENADGVDPVRHWKVRTPTQMFPAMIMTALPTVSGEEVRDYDIKIVLTKNHTSFYGRVHGAPDWTFIYDTSGADSISDVTIYLWNQNYDDPPGDPPYVDSIKLVKNSPISDSRPEYLFWDSFIGGHSDLISTIGWTIDPNYSNVYISTSWPIDDTMGHVVYPANGYAVCTKSFATPIALSEGDVFRMTATTLAWSNYSCDNLATFGLGTDVGWLACGMHSPGREQISPGVWKDPYAVWRGSVPGVGYNLEGSVPGADWIMDVKIEFTKRTARFYTRVHGTTDWKLANYWQGLNISELRYLLMEFYQSNWSWPNWYFYPRLDELVVKRYTETIDPASIVFQEDFSSYTADADIASPGGWQQVDGPNPIIARTAQRDGTSIDSGMMAMAGSAVSYPGITYQRPLPNPVQIAAGQSVTTQGVVYANAGYDCVPNEAGIHVVNPAGAKWGLKLYSNNSQNVTITNEWVLTSPSGTTRVVAVAGGGTYDAKIVVSPTACQFYARPHGTPDWALLGGDNSGSTGLSGIGIFLHCNNWSPGWWEWTYVDSLIMYGGTVAVTYTDYSLADAKKRADNDLVKCVGTVTAVFGDSFYIEDADRVSGIRVTKAGHGVQPGAGVVVSGKMATLDSTERYIAADLIEPGTADTITPLGMTNKVLGGISMTDGAGLDNVGLLIKTTGIVSASTEANSFNMTDGSGVALRAFMPNGGALPENGKYVVATGISSCDKTGTDVQRMLQVLSYQVEN